MRVTGWCTLGGVAAGVFLLMPIILFATRGRMDLGFFLPTIIGGAITGGIMGLLVGVMIDNHRR
jgi:hypothetical protein